MAMDYEQARKILEMFPEFPYQNEEGQREIISYGTRRGMIKGNGGKISGAFCSPHQAYAVSKRLYGEAERVYDERTQEIDLEIEETLREEKTQRESGRHLDDFLRNTGTNAENWGDLEDLRDYLNPQ